jgi:hypothetical protein
MNLLVNGAPEERVVADRTIKVVKFKKFLDNEKRPSPIHTGAMARGDDDLSKVDEERIDFLKSVSRDGVYLTEQQITQFFNHVNCMGKPMQLKDRIPHYAERELLMGLFRDYIEVKGHTKMLPLELVVNFLEKNILPVDFKKSHAPATISSVIFTLIRNAHLILREPNC